jgi:hypothetical protein
MPDAAIESKPEIASAVDLPAVRRAINRRAARFVPGVSSLREYGPVVCADKRCH